MKRKPNHTNRILVVDIESTAWQGQPPPGEYPEIIEVGVSVVDISKLEVIDTRSWIIKPENSKVSEFCTQLTTITQKMVDNGRSFESVCDIIHDDLYAPDYPWASYGAYDLTMFTRQCEREQVPYPFSKRHINIKTLSAMCQSLPEEVGMDKMLEYMDIDLVGTHHRAGDDSKNIANILIRILEG